MTGSSDSTPCSGHGDVVHDAAGNATCACDYYFNGADCSIPLSEAVGYGGWAAFMVVLLLLHIICAVAMLMAFRRRFYCWNVCLCGNGQQGSGSGCCRFRRHHSTDQGKGEQSPPAPRCCCCVPVTSSNMQRITPKPFNRSGYEVVDLPSEYSTANAASLSNATAVPATSGPLYAGEEGRIVHGGITDTKKSTGASYTDETNGEEKPRVNPLRALTVASTRGTQSQLSHGSAGYTEYTDKYAGAFGPRISSVRQRRFLRACCEVNIRDVAGYLNAIAICLRIVWSIDVLWMGSFTLMVIVWVGIVKAAKGNTMTVKMKKIGYAVVVALFIVVTPLLVLEFLADDSVLITSLGNGVFALYLLVMDVWGVFYAVQVVSLTRSLKAKLRSTPRRQSLMAAHSHAAEEATRGTPMMELKEDDISTADTRVYIHGADTVAAMYRVVRNIGFIITVSIASGTTLIIIVVLLLVVPISPQGMPVGYFVCLWGTHVVVEGAAAIVLTFTTYQR